MAVELIDSIITPQVDAQLQATINALKQVIALIAQVNGTNVNIGGSGGSGSGRGQGTAQVDAMQQAIDRLNRAQSQLGQDIAIVNEQTRQQNVLNAQAARQTIAASGSLNDLRAKLAAATTAFDNLSAAERNAFGAGQIANIRALQTEVRTLEQSTGRFQRNVGNYPQALTGFLGAAGVPGGSALGSILTGGALLGGTAALGAIGKEVYDVTLKLDTLNSGLKAVSKTNEEYAINQQFLKETTDKFGLSLIEVTGAYKNFYASATVAGLSANQTRKIFSQVSEVSANLKLTQEDTNGVLLAFSQSLGKGKIAAEELRGQIGERIPGATAIMAKALGLTNAQLEKMLATGKILSQDALPKFAEELVKTFGNGGKPVDTLQASINRLSNSFTDLVNNNGSSLSGFFKNIVDEAQGVLNIFTDISHVKLVNSEDIATLIKNLRETQSLSPEAAAGLDKSINQDILKKFAEVKKQNDQYISEFSEYTKSIQKTTIETLKGDIDAAQKLLDNARATTGKYSQESIENLLQVVKLRDRLAREQTAYAQTTASTAPTGPTAQQQIDLRKKLIDALAAIDDEDLKRRQARDKEISEDQGQTLSEKLKAESDYTQASNELAERKAKRDKDIIKENIPLYKDVAESLKAVDSKLRTDQENNARESGKNIKKILADDLQDRVNALKQAFSATNDQSSSQEADKVAAEAKRYAAQRDAINQTEYTNKEQRRIDEDKNEEEHQHTLTKIAYDGARERLVNQIKLQDSLIELDSKSKNSDGSESDKQLQDEAALVDQQNALYQLDVKNFSDAESKKSKAVKDELAQQAQLRQEEVEKAKQLGEESFKFLQALGDASFDRAKDRLQSQIDDIEVKKKADEDAIDATSESDEEKTNQKAIIDKQYDAQTTQLKNKQRKIDEEKAKFDKAASIAHIIAATAEAVIGTLSKTPPPAGLPLAILVGAIGAAELATAIATPIPHYRYGKMTGGPAEWAVTGDGGQHEVMMGPTGDAYVTPNTSTLTRIPEKYRVFPSMDAWYKEVGHRPMWNLQEPVVAPGQVMDITQITTPIVQAIKDNKQIVNVNATFAGIQTSFITASGITNYLNQRVYGKL